DLVRGAVPVAEPADPEDHPRRGGVLRTMGPVPGLFAGAGRAAVGAGGVALQAGEAGDLGLRPLQEGQEKARHVRRAFSLLAAASEVTAGTRWCGGWWSPGVPAGSASASPPRPPRARSRG